MSIAEQSYTKCERVEEESDAEMRDSEDSNADMTASGGGGLEPPLDEKLEIRLRDIPGLAQFMMVFYVKAGTTQLQTIRI